MNIDIGFAVRRRVFTGFFFLYNDREERRMDKLTGRQQLC